MIYVKATLNIFKKLMIYSLAFKCQSQIDYNKNRILKLYAYFSADCINFVIIYILYNINVDHISVTQKTDDKSFRKIIMTDKISHKIFRIHS